MVIGKTTYYDSHAEGQCLRRRDEARDPVEGENPGIQAVAEDVMTGVDEPMQGDEEPLPALVADEEQDEPMRTVEDPTPAVEDFADASEDWAAHDAQDAEQGFEEGDAALFFDVAEGDEEDEL